MLKLLVISLVFALSLAGNTKERIVRSIQNWNNDVACWGRENSIKWRLAQIEAMEECGKSGNIANLLRPVSRFSKLQQNPWIQGDQSIRGNLGSSGQRWTNLWSDFLAGRTKRDAEPLLEFDEEEEMENFLEDFADFKEDLGSNIGNLTCVLTKMNLLDSSLQVNLQLYTEDVWEKIDLRKTLAGEDPSWRRKVIQGYSDCYQLAQNWPQESLEKNPLTKVFGRHMIFFKCAKKVESKMCAKAQINDWVTTMYGSGEGIDWSQLGLPQDKYERASLIIMVMTEQSSKEEKFVDDFFNKNEH